MGRLKTACAIFLIILFSLPLSAGISSFKDEVEEAEKSGKKEQSSSSSKKDDENSSLVEFLFNLFFLFWYNNCYVSYGPYPYSSGGYILGPQYSGGAGGFLQNPRSQGGKFAAFSAETEAFWLKGLGYGGWAGFRGNLLKLIGPELDAFAVKDGESSFYSIRAGGALYLIQTNPFTAKLLVQYQRWWLDDIQRSGVVVGVEVVSFPVKPLTLAGRFNGQIFGAFTVSEAEIEAGIMINRWNLRGGYRWWIMKNETKGDQIYSGPYLGVSCYF